MKGVLPHLLLIGQRGDFLSRAKKLCSDFGIGDFVVARVEDLQKLSLPSDPRTVLLDTRDIWNQTEIASRVQVTKFSFPQTSIIVIAEHRIKADAAAFIKKSGAEAVLLENEFIETTKLDFIVSQYVFGNMIPVKITELLADTQVTFTLHHMLPLNRKIIPFIFAGQTIEPAKMRKLEEIGEFYIKNTDLDLFQKYVEDNQDTSAAGIKARCRAKYLHLVITYKKLVLNLSDESEAASFQQGRELYEKLLRLSSELITYLGTAGEAWDIVDIAGFNDLTAVDRAPAIAAYAGLFSLLSEIGRPEEVMVAALIADIGLLDLPPAALRVWKTGCFDDFKPEDQRIYRHHPTISLNKCLSRRLPIPDHIKAIILNTHERWDQKGFPNRPQNIRIPSEAMIIHFAELLDLGVKLEYGKERRNRQVVRTEILEREIRNLDRFPIDLMSKISAAIRSAA